ncbi:MAG: Gfo/Idh/MocA family oxidoreductase [Pirellulales bacterium]|nr:Gfo/Idh/MocA family oxidoreductase [Pirellulales bacterium]
MDRVKLGLIGLGEWPRQAYVPALKELEGIEVAAVAAKSSATQQFARAEFGGAAVYSDFQDLLDDPRVDAVLLAVPNPIHENAMLAAVSSGKHLFYEPPVSHRFESVERLHATMSAADRVIQPDFELRWLPVVCRLREQLRAGLIGEIRMAAVRLWCNWGYGGGQWKYNPQAEGFFPWLSCWYLDVLDCVLAAGPERATVTGGYAANGRLMDHGWASLEYPGGKIGRFEFNLVAVGGLEVTLSVLGSRGEAEAELIQGGLRWRGPDGVWQETAYPAAQPAYGFVGMRECLGGFVESVRTGAAPEPHVEISRRVHTAMLLCAEAERTRATAELQSLG